MSVSVTPVIKGPVRNPFNSSKSLCFLQMLLNLREVTVVGFWGGVVEKREFPREGVNIEAVINSGKGEGSLCKIRDYSQEGMFIVMNDGRFLKSLRTRVMNLDALVTITFKTQSRYVAIDGIVVHQQDNGLGIRFVHASKKHLQEIAQAHSERQQQKPSPQDLREEFGRQHLAGAKKSSLMNGLNKQLSAFVNEYLPEFLPVLEQALLDEAEVQSSDAAQQAYFDTLNGLKRLGDRLGQQMLGILSADAVDVANGKWPEAQQHESANSGALSLVEKEEFEDWLVVRVATSRTELQFREVLIELQLRLDVAFGAESAARVYNPYGPSALCQAFYQCIKVVRPSQKVERLVFKIFQTKFLTHLGPFYKGLNRSLIEAGILPDVNVAKYLAHQARNKKPPAPAPAGDQPAEAKPQPEAGPAPDSAAPQPAPTMADQPVPGGLGSYEKLQAGLAQARSAYATASRLWQIHSRPGEAPVVADVNGQINLPAPVLNAYSEAIQSVRQQVLSEMVNLDQPGALREHIASAVGPDSPLQPEHLESAEMIETLFTNIVENARIDQALRSELRKLELPLLEILLTDPGLFTAEYHPARQAVNHLSLLSDRGSINLKNNRPVITDSVQKLVEAGVREPQVVEDVLQSLEVLVEREKQLIERNLSRVTEACDGQERVRSANTMVEKELKQRLAEQPVPKVILSLIANGWRDLMRLCYFREGLESRAWEMTLIVIDQLLLRVLPGAYDESQVLFKADELLKLVRKGLSKVEKNPTQSDKLVEQLALLLQDHAPDQEQFEAYQEPDEIRSASAERLNKLGVPSDDRAIQRWLKRVQKLKEGQWLEFGQDPQNSVLNQLAWISEPMDRYVFVNHHGMKVQDLSTEELALMLKQGDAIVLSDSEMPAVERGLDALIQKIYDQLAQESSHDQLTGLKTRKEFERSIAQAVARCKRHSMSYVLVYLDVLQFKVINNTCGYEVGDEFLRNVAGRIQAVVNDDAMIGRIGANEFGILVPVDNERGAYLLTTEIKSQVEQERFVSGEQSFVISTAVSMVVFDESNNQVMELLRSVESAAEIGKKSGQRDIQVVHPGDHRMEERDEVMSWVARINQALDEENLKIRCQMIYPTSDEGPALPHFEILLTVIDQTGEHLPPADFIRAAEEYSRMSSVDRWVIQNVLIWMCENPEILAQIGGFSINLSGHSLNDETFLDFIFEALVRYQVPRQKLIFEITETTAVANLEDAADFINEMRGIGCRFSLDDFGAGQSSYAYLKRLPVDFIKVDGAFVKNIAEDDVDYALVKSITEMGHFLSKKIVAEYVSNRDILEVVKDIGVDYVQGFYLGRPVMIDDLGGALQPANQVA